MLWKLLCFTTAIAVIVKLCLRKEVSPYMYLDPSLLLVLKTLLKREIWDGTCPTSEQTMPLEACDVRQSKT